MIHKLLQRQLKVLSLDPNHLPSDLKSWQVLLERISNAYSDGDQERYLLERSLQISSKEMKERYQALDLEKAKALHAEKFATLGEMAGGIAHEINNPLGLIGVLAGQLKEMSAENSLNSEVLTDFLTQIEESVWRVAKIVKALRGFSRDGSKDAFSSVAVQKILDDVTVLCSERFKQYNVSFQVAMVEPDLTIECREVEVCQILLNLLNNAFDAIQSHQEKSVELKIHEANGDLEFSVTNSGNKIRPEVIKKLFHPFFTTKEVGKGTGLGLSISKKIAENHGGVLYYDEAGSNCRFVLRIPKTQGSLKTAA
jgi:C4-dicarboxylate-specific signal transduction histidine kinase